ncbi:NUDIX hydrolase [Cyclobacterium marinum]|uniref:NUDIX hydrolase n=1 Tax=Cyclobacterium marinum (strain ATCC 25205 / DSM 745 / LMG 13164 / NCIMB 1802) TaxID=880070 RepID=G0IUG5_CYCMS|nr:NUDIX hydrolase [Cyclobacterium marinum]AEL24728.1 NUDIX hydrolase [Cyclobacterium marinum DSM 745]MBI0401795.1 NUDIX hydrolase [Cyclobacterium marinum]|tara:strand:- start:82017 stop:82706 length:690 start_codon:yes stop_codon:yes gene_type:complete
MKIFINDKPLDLVGSKNFMPKKSFECVYDNPKELPPSAEFHDDVLIKNPSKDIIVQLLYLLRSRKLKNLDSITLVTDEKAILKKFIKSRFLIIKAAGGVVTKGDSILFIHRLGKWDLPKGKFEKKETPEGCAVREVEEECNIKVKLNKPICITWHTYTQNKKSILKKTYWYKMKSIDDSMMKPQVEEGINDIKWLKHHEAKTALINSYPSMRYLYKRFLKMTPKIAQTL